MKRFCSLIFLSVGILWGGRATAEWNFDFSRRVSKKPQKEKLRQPAAAVIPQVEPLDLWEGLQQSEEPIQEVAILSTKKGFIPDRVRLRAGQRYRVTVVNVNEEHKNISFVLESFSEFHGTYYGELKSFVLKPAAAGQAAFTTPELGHRGQFIILPPLSEVELRKPAQE